MQHASLHSLAAKRRAQTRRAQMRPASFLSEGGRRGETARKKKYFVWNFVLDKQEKEIYTAANIA